MGVDDKETSCSGDVGEIMGTSPAGTVVRCSNADGDLGPKLRKVGIVRLTGGLSQMCADGDVTCPLYQSAPVNLIGMSSFMH